MAASYHHAMSSAKRFGGIAADYLPVHDWFDATKATMGDFRHRALRHHTLGIFDAERLFGTTIMNSYGRSVPVRLIGEQHVIEDCGYLPTPQDWLRCLKPEPWMNRPLKLSRMLGEQIQRPVDGERPLNEPLRVRASQHWPRDARESVDQAVAADRFAKHGRSSLQAPNKTRSTRTRYDGDLKGN
jgi:hypothetical protein